MDIDDFFMKLYILLNETDAFNIASLVVDQEHEDRLLVELICGEKYEIQIRSTDVVI